jgi:glutathione S-transferase
VRIALHWKHIEHTNVYVNLLKAEQSTSSYVEMNPGARVPSLIVDGGVVLTQSLAILEYLEEAYPGECQWVEITVGRASLVAS